MENVGSKTSFPPALGWAGLPGLPFLPLLGCEFVSCHLEASRTFLLQKKCPNAGPVACPGQRQGPKVPRRNCWNQDCDGEDSVTAQGLTAGDKDSILTHGWKGLFPIRPQSFPASLSSSSTRWAVGPSGPTQTSVLPGRGAVWSAAPISGALVPHP